MAGESSHPGMLYPDNIEENEVEKDNLALWKAVEKTDPKFTKEFNRGGGFKGTAINPTSLIMKATDTFGLPGIGWGYEIVKEEMLFGAFIADGVQEQTHCLQVKLWYMAGGNRGEIEHFGATTYVGKNKYGTFTDEEAKKKTLTDAITKCLSWLGFSADVHLGRYDDSKYVNDMRVEFGKTTPTPPVVSPPADVAAIRDSAIPKVAACNNKDELKVLWDELGIDKSNPTLYAAILEVFNARIAQIKRDAQP